MACSSPFSTGGASPPALPLFPEHPAPRNATVVSARARLHALCKFVCFTFASSIARQPTGGASVYRPFRSGPLDAPACSLSVTVGGGGQPLPGFPPRSAARQ